MARPTLYMLVGLPCSGKSTEVESLLRVHPDAVVLSTDNFIELRAKALRTTYNKIFESTIGEATSNLYATLKEAQIAGKDIIWDQTNLNVKTRADKLKTIYKEYYKVAYVFNEEFEVILDRNETRGKETGKLIPYDVLQSMKRTLRVPTKDEGFDEIIYKNDAKGMRA